MNSNPNLPDDQWSSYFTIETTFTHTYGAYLNNKHFYKIVAFKIYREEDIHILNKLKIQMRKRKITFIEVDKRLKE